MTTYRHEDGHRPPERSRLWRSVEEPIGCSLPFARQPGRQERAASNWSAPPAVLVEASARKEGYPPAKLIQKHGSHLLQMTSPESTPQETHRRFIMAHHKLLRLSATLLFIGLVVFGVTIPLHPPGANDHQAAFTAYANSSSWAAIHLGQFVGTAVIIAGLLVLFFALNVSEGTPRWLGFFGAIAAGVALALAGVRFAVDGVALKQATDAWVSAPAAEQAARFASAEAIRWLEWGTRSYQSFMSGLALVLLATTIVWTARITRPIGYIMGLNGLASIVQGWVIGTEGFSVTNGVTYDISGLATIVWMIWLLIVAWRMKESVQAAPA